MGHVRPARTGEVTLLSTVTNPIVLAIAALAVLGFRVARQFKTPDPQPSAVVRQVTTPVPTPPYGPE